MQMSNLNNANSLFIIVHFSTHHNRFKKIIYNKKSDGHLGYERNINAGEKRLSGYSEAFSDHWTSRKMCICTILIDVCLIAIVIYLQKLTDIIY